MEQKDVFYNKAEYIETVSSRSILIAAENLSLYGNEHPWSYLRLFHVVLHRIFLVFIGFYGKLVNNIFFIVLGLGK